MPNRPVVVAVAALVVLFAGWRLLSWYTSPERRINVQLGEIRKLIAKAPGENNLEALAKARKATDLFADSFEFEARQYPDKEISVDAEHQRATSHVTVQFITKARDLAGREAYRFQINWVERDGEWRMDYVRLLEVLEDPPRNWIP